MSTGPSEMNGCCGQEPEHCLCDKTTQHSIKKRKDKEYLSAWCKKCGLWSGYCKCKKKKKKKAEKKTKKVDLVDQEHIDIIKKLAKEAFKADTEPYGHILLVLITEIENLRKQIKKLKK